MPTFIEIDAKFANELRLRLSAQGQDILAAQIETLAIVGHCDCDMKDCATLYASARNTARGRRKSFEVEDAGRLVIVDSVDGEVVVIEVLDHPALRTKLDRAFGTKQR